jgi:hypothetical protein
MWEPVAGDVIAGKKISHHFFDEKTDLLLIDKNGLVTNIILNAYLRKNLIYQGAIDGALVLIEYRGAKKNKAGFWVKRYKLRVMQ